MKIIICGAGEVGKTLAERLSKEKVPSKWFLLDEIPKTDRGKVNRFNVAELCKTKSPLKN